MIKFLSLILITMSGWTLPCLGDQATVHVRHEAQVANSNVELGTIADITSTDTDNERALSSLIVGESPQPGKTVEWSAAEITKRLRAYNRILQGVQIKVPDHIVIRRVPDDSIAGLGRVALKAQIEEMLKTMLPDSSWEARVTEISVPDNIVVPHDGSVQVVPPMMRPRGATQVEVRVVAAGQIVRRIWVPCRVNYFARVGTIIRQVEARSHLEASDLKWEKKDVTNLLEIPTVEADLPSAVTKTTLLPGMILNRTMLEREMALRFGETVDLTAGDEDFAITAKGVAQQNGFIGDVVKVKNVATNKIIDGVVTGPGTVHVRF